MYYLSGSVWLKFQFFWDKLVCCLNFRIKKPFRSTQVRQGMPALHKAPITAQIPGPLVQRLPCAASRPAEPRGLLRSSHRELPGGTAEWSNQCPQVQQHTNPTGGHLDPEDRPAPTEEGFNVGTFIAVGTRDPMVRAGREWAGEGLFHQVSPHFCPHHISFFPDSIHTHLKCLIQWLLLCSQTV